MRRPDATARSALALYRRSTASTRAHVTVRWWSAPFAEVAAYLPSTGPVLEIGCGHGLFVAYAAKLDLTRTVLGVDIDAAKIAEGARALAPLGPRARLAVAESGAVPPGPWAAIVFLDMLYLLPAREQQRLLAEAAAALAPDGVLLVKEMADRPAWKARWNRVQETLAVRVLRITAGHDFDFVPTSQVCRWLADSGLATEVVRLDRGRVHPHALVVGRRPEAGAAGR